MPDLEPLPDFEPLPDPPRQPGRTRPAATALAPAAMPLAVAPSPLALGPDLSTQVRSIRSLSAVRPATTVRRALFMWLRIFVDEEKASGKRQRVNIRVPIPLPLFGLLLPWRMSSREALALLAQAQHDPDALGVLERGLVGHTAFDFVRVHEENPRTGYRQQVVIGLE